MNTGVTVMDHGREMSTQDDRSMVDVQSSRAVAEVQSAMTIAKKFPRDHKSAFIKIMAACSRKSLAEVAVYEYPRGGEKVRGPSIRLAEAVAQSWGNIATGVVELDRREGESLALAYCVDLETNYRKDITFSVPHVRDRQGGGKALTETRDIYELVANMGARRLRNCIMAVIPGDIFDEAEAKCQETLTKDEAPLADRIRIMLASFADWNVTEEMIAKKFGCKVEALSAEQLAKLRGTYQSLKDGMGTAKDFFDVAPTEPSRTDKLNQAVAAKASGPIPKTENKPAAAPAVGAKLADADPGSFANFNGNLFSGPTAETMESVQDETLGLLNQLKYSPARFYERVKTMFNKPVQDLSLEECKRIRDHYKGEVAKAGVK